MLNEKLEQAYEDTPALPIIGYVLLAAIVSSIFFFLTSFQVFLESDLSLHALLNATVFFALNFILSMVLCKHICDLYVCIFKNIELNDFHMIIKLLAMVSPFILYATQRVTIDSFSEVQNGNFVITACLITCAICGFYINKIAVLIEEETEIVETKTPKEVLNVYSAELLAHADKNISGIELMEHYFTLLKEIEHVLDDAEMTSLNERQIHLMKVLASIDTVKLASTDELIKQAEEVIAGINEEVAAYILKDDARIMASAERKLARMGAKRDVQ